MRAGNNSRRTDLSSGEVRLRLWPSGENRARTVSSVAVKGRFPTYSLVTANYSRNKGNEQEGPASWFARLSEGGRRWPEHAPERHKAKGRQAERSRAWAAGYSNPLCLAEISCKG